MANEWRERTRSTVAYQIKVVGVRSGDGKQNVAAERGLVKVALAQSLLHRPDAVVAVEDGALLTTVEEVLRSFGHVMRESIAEQVTRVLLTAAGWMKGATRRKGLRKLCLLDMGARAIMRWILALRCGCWIMAMKKRPVPSE